MWQLLGALLPLGEVAAVAVVGLTAAGFALFLGRRLLGRLDGSASVPLTSATVELAMPGPGSERRTSARRRGSSVAAFLADDSDLEPTEVWVVDRSLGGVCLLAEAPVEVGSQLRVRPRHASGPQWTSVRVRFCRRDRNGWMVHCQFLQMPPTNVMLLFG
jgi:hypothetical protein